MGELIEGRLHKWGKNNATLKEFGHMEGNVMVRAREYTVKNLGFDLPSGIEEHAIVTAEKLDGRNVSIVGYVYFTLLNEMV